MATTAGAGLRRSERIGGRFGGAIARMVGLALIALPAGLAFPIGVRSVQGRGGDPAVETTPRARNRAGAVTPTPQSPGDFYVVRTFDCPQQMGTDPWPCQQLLYLAPDNTFVEGDWRHLLDQARFRPVLFIVHGNLNAGNYAVEEALLMKTWMHRLGALPPDALVVVFDWPSQRVRANPIRDINEKCLRAFVAGYHLARVLEAFPAGSRICLLGQSYGGRVIPAALHLWSGAEMTSHADQPRVRLKGPRPPLHLRAILIEAASDHHWLNPGETFGQALASAEGLLNLYNSQDRVLFFYPLLYTGDGGRALGRVGLLPLDRTRLGPLITKYEQFDVSPWLHRKHTMLGTVTHPEVARRIARYTWAAPIPDHRPVPAPRAARSAVPE